ncbi:MAG TPA: hypothetical protein VE645_12455 [Pseudonocardiaceae bacterium]|nr:hypothetical protein [Pseudonocardiaceae bacterium]
MANSPQGGTTARIAGSTSIAVSSAARAGAGALVRASLPASSLSILYWYTTIRIQDIDGLPLGIIVRSWVLSHGGGAPRFTPERAG